VLHKKNKKGREGREGEGRERVLKLSSSSLHLNLEGINSIEENDRRVDFIPFSFQIKFSGVNNKLKFSSPSIHSLLLPIL
jgi:hypothetical protein